MTNEEKTIDTAKLIGATKEQANDYLAEYGMYIRVTKINNNYTVCTRDYKPERINVSLFDGKIIEINGLG